MIHIICNKVVPPKVLLLSWRTLNKRILPKDNLVRCLVVPSGFLWCVGGCMKGHLFLDSDFFGGLWHYVLCWLRICFVHPIVVCMHVLQFNGSHML